MVQLARAVEPFGEVNVNRRGDGRIDVSATILSVPAVEGAKAGLALDASESMRSFYGASGVVSPILAAASAKQNIIEPMARSMAEFLAKFAGDDSVDVLYWACGVDGTQTESIGRFSAATAETIQISGPQQHQFGRKTCLLPPVRYFVEQSLHNAPWAIGVIITDGLIDDLDEVIEYTTNFARAIASGGTRFIKLVAIGICTEKDEARMREQLETLDDCLDELDLRDPDGNLIDVWDHKLGKTMQRLDEVFAEVVSENAIILPAGSILDSSRSVVKQYPNDQHTGLPALLIFTLPANATSFTLQCEAGEFVQDISEGLSR